MLIFHKNKQSYKTQTTNIIILRKRNTDNIQKFDD